MEINLNPYLSVDCVVFGYNSQTLKVLLLKRKRKSTERKFLKLPGSLVPHNEDLDLSAIRVLKELTGMQNIFLKQFHAFGALDRISGDGDRMWIENTYQVKTERIVSVAYYSLVKIEESNPTSSNLNETANWYNIDDITTLAFDHETILETGLKAIRQELFLNPIIGFKLLPEKFTIRQLQKLYEIILNTKLDNRNFRKKILQAKYIKPLGEKQTGVAHKPALLYSFEEEEYLESRKQIVNFHI